MQRIFATTIGLLLMGVALSLLGQEAPAEHDPGLIAAQSEKALDQGDVTKALGLIQEGLARFPGDENLQAQLARIYAFQKHDHQAIVLLSSILQSNPASRSAKLALAQILGYREDYRHSDRLYRELLAADENDEAASLGLIHNLILEGKKAQARAEIRRAIARHPTSLELLRYSDYVSQDSAGEVQSQQHNHAQTVGSFFSDTSGNRSLYSSLGMVNQIHRTLSSRLLVEQTTLWKPDSVLGTVDDQATVVSANEEIRLKPVPYMAMRAGGGVVRFADRTNEARYSGDLELYPWKDKRDLLISAGFSRFPVLATVDAARFDLMSEGWHGRVDYRTSNFSLAGDAYLTHYTDGNLAERESAEALRWFGLGSWAIAGGYAVRHMHFAQDPSHGYFSPAQYHSHLAAAGVRFHIGTLFRAEYLGYGGEELLGSLGSYSPAGQLLLKNDFALARWDLSVDYSYLHLIQPSGAFRANALSVAVAYKF
jgi:tetratricopeptide (TPR) repeat protein